MRTIVYPGPGHVLVAGKRRIERGVPTEVSEELFKQLQRDPSMKLLELTPQAEPAGEPAADEPAEPDQPADEADEIAGDGEEERE